MRLFNHFVFLYLLFVCLCNVAKSFPTSICISTHSNKEERLTNNGSSLWVSLILINRPPPYFLPMLLTTDSHLILRTISVWLSAMLVVDLQNHWIQNHFLAIFDYWLFFRSDHSLPMLVAHWLSTFWNLNNLNLICLKQSMPGSVAALAMFS